ncbi:MAG TPA: hypothetical protein VKA15_16375 [Isosphaeraceae bacterium]|nr:hypothetical protein [Isosphaeraceae bacterium]
MTRRTVRGLVNEALRGGRGAEPGDVRNPTGSNQHSRIKCDDVILNPPDPVILPIQKPDMVGFEATEPGDVRNPYGVTGKPKEEIITNNVGNNLDTLTLAIFPPTEAKDPVTGQFMSDTTTITNNVGNCGAPTSKPKRIADRIATRSVIGAIARRSGGRHHRNRGRRINTNIVRIDYFLWFSNPPIGIIAPSRLASHGLREGV